MSIRQGRGKRRVAGEAMMEQKPDLGGFAQILQDLIEEEGITAYELSMQAGIPQHRVYRYIKGLVENPTVEDMAKIAKFFHLDLNQLGAALGIWMIPEQESEMLGHELATQLDRLRSLGGQLGPEAQDEFAADLEILVSIWHRRLIAAAQVKQKTASKRVPSWLQRRSVTS